MTIKQWGALSRDKQWSWARKAKKPELVDLLSQYALSEIDAGAYDNNDIMHFVIEGNKGYAQMSKVELVQELVGYLHEDESDWGEDSP